MIKACCLVLFLVIKTSTQQQKNLKSLGEGSLLQSLHHINLKNEHLSSKYFIKNFVSKEIPVVYTNSVRLKNKNIWKDETLVKFENISVSVDLCKVENRSCNSMNPSLTHFINNYKTRRYYLVDNLPEFLIETYFVPSMLLCKEIINKLQVNWL